MTMPNGVVATYTFDSNNRLTKIEHENAAGTNLYTAVYTLDSAGMRTSITETGINRANRELNFSYDNLYQLIQESDSSRNNGAATTYSYDAQGNRIQKEDNGVITTYTVDKLNRVTAATTGGEVISYSYDANGNTVAKTAGGVTHTYCYDRENRLTGVLAGEEEIFSAIYDYRSRRLEKTENGDTISYLYDGGVSVQEYDAEGSLKTFLLRAGGYGGGIGDVVYTENGSSGEREYFLYNAIGSTSALTDDSGSVISTTNYGAWGAETGTTGSSENVRKFSTKERSASIGLDYFGFRYYDYDLGRFTTRDPSGYPDGPNNYLYCDNNPVNKIDALGLYSWWDDVIGTATEFSKMAWQGTKEVASIIGEGSAAVVTGKSSVKDLTAGIGKNVVDKIDGVIEKNANRISAQVEGGSSWAGATVATAGAMVGDVMGYTPLLEGAHGTDLASGQQLSEVDRASRMLTGGGQLILSGIAVGKTYDPNASFSSTLRQIAGKQAPQPGAAETPASASSTTSSATSMRGSVATRNGVARTETAVEATKANNTIPFAGEPKSFADYMTPTEASRYNKYWGKHAPEINTPYSTYNRYTSSGDLKQVTTYDQHGFRHRQIDLLDERGRPEHFHEFNVSNKDYKGRRGKKHKPLENF